MTERERIKEIISRLQKEYDKARIALEFKDPFQLLVAVILSAQCTDVRVNMITPALFERFPGPREMAQADVSEIEEIIRSCGFFRNKAKNIKAAAAILVEKFGGKVPDNMKDLLTLPGVARKTANVVLFNAYGVIEGIAVDTHVKRLAKRLGLTRETDPVKIERDLMQKIPKELWGRITYLLIEHGRRVCKARKPACDQCILKDLCPHFKKTSAN
ncbi:MAG: endonuclease III [Thermodesulfatator sp.]|nr:MAG: endonuclease III [Thermodesulfatator sp.]